jgi:carbon storage regulator CsrA
MLVLSRRQGQRIFFPHLDIAVQVLSSKGSTVRLGIEAPPHIEVLREEIASKATVRTAANQTENWDRHDLRGRLNTVSMALYVVERQLKAGLTADAERTLHEAQEVLEKLPPTIGQPRSESPCKPIEALLVEDNPNEEALLSSYLRLSGFRVQTVHDGYEALDFLSGHEQPDFLLLDMRLPRLDGQGTVAAIRKNPAYRGLTIFAVSGSSPDEFDLSTGAEGVNAWFQKPLNPKRIVDAMSAVVSRN